MTKILAAVAVVLLTASVASAGGYPYVVASPVVYGPTPVVVNYGPVAPVYPYAPYTVYSPAPYVVASPVVTAPGPVVYGPTFVYRAPRYVRPWLYVPGQPVRNALRATFR